MSSTPYHAYSSNINMSHFILQEKQNCDNDHSHVPFTRKKDCASPLDNIEGLNICTTNIIADPPPTVFQQLPFTNNYWPLP